MISLIHFIQSTEQARNLTIWGQAKKAAWALLFLDTGGKAMHCPHRSGQRGHVLGPHVVRSSDVRRHGPPLSEASIQREE